jgi:hypothetical protein
MSNLSNDPRDRQGASAIRSIDARLGADADQRRRSRIDAESTRARDGERRDRRHWCYAILGSAELRRGRHVRAVTMLGDDAKRSRTEKPDRG